MALYGFRCDTCGVPGVAFCPMEERNTIKPTCNLCGGEMIRELSEPRQLLTCPDKYSEANKEGLHRIKQTEAEDNKRYDERWNKPLPPLPV